MNKYFRIAVSVALLGWVAWKTDWGQLGAAFAGLRIDLWLAALGILLVCQLASARRWQVLARELRFERTLKQLTGYYLIGMYFSLLLPTSVGGDVMRALYLDGGSGRKLGAFAAVLLDRLNGLLVLIAMACLAVALSPTELPAAIVWSVWSVAAAAILGLAALPVLERLQRVPAARRQQLRTMILALRAPRALVEATAWSVVVQVGNVVLVWLIGVGLGVTVPLSYYFVFIPMVSLLTLLPISVAGTGVREESVALFLTPFAVAPALATTLSLLWFAVFAAAGLIGGVVYLCGAYPKSVSQPRDLLGEPEPYGSFGRYPDQGRTGQLDEAA